jgi:hypothetical protein
MAAAEVRGGVGDLRGILRVAEDVVLAAPAVNACSENAQRPRRFAGGGTGAPRASSLAMAARRRSMAPDHTSTPFIAHSASRAKPQSARRIIPTRGHLRRLCARIDHLDGAGVEFERPSLGPATTAPRDGFAVRQLRLRLRRDSRGPHALKMFDKSGFAVSL